MPTLTVVAGANGAGKSTLTRLGRMGFQDNPMLDPDAIASSHRLTGVSQTSAIEAAREVLERTEALLSKCESFLIETTLSGHTHLQMMRRAKSLDYLIVLIYVGTTDVSINMRRVRDRVRGGGHDVPEEDQLRRYPRSFANLQRAFALADEAILFDNSTHLGHKRVAVKDAKGVDFFEPIPAWAEFLRRN